jgi:hypothetical protein
MGEAVGAAMRHNARMAADYHQAVMVERGACPWVLCPYCPVREDPED